MPRAKKPPVRPATRLQWLKRYEEYGETSPQIASADKYDVRTVRKHIELARQEREEREASVMILRNAKENHYGDLISYAEKMDKEIQQASIPLASERLYVALHEHLPRSPLWKGLDKLKDLKEAVHNKETGLNQAAVNLIKKETKRVFNKEPEELGFDIEGTAGALVHRTKQSEGPFPLEIKDEKVKEGLREIQYGPWNCGVVPENQVADIKKFIAAMMSSINSKPDAKELKNVLEERRIVIENIREELATIIMKRIVPGRCKYCPF
jgi:hypothetical protein